MVEEVRRDPVTGDTVVVRRGGNSTLWIVLLLLIALAALAYFTGLINVSGKVEAPKVSVTGGETPTVTTGKIVAGTRKEVVDVPTVVTEKKVVDVPVAGVQKAPGADSNK